MLASPTTTDFLRAPQPLLEPLGLLFSFEPRIRKVDVAPRQGAQDCHGLNGYLVAGAGLPAPATHG